MIEFINTIHSNVWSCISAVSTLVAVLTALGIHFHAEWKRDKKEEINRLYSILSALRGIRAELKSYELGVNYLTQTASEMTSVYDAKNINVGQTLIILGESEPGFTFYNNSAGIIGMVKNDNLLSEMVGFYSYIDMFFDTYRAYREKALIIDKIRLEKQADEQYKINTLKDLFESLDGLITEFKDRVQHIKPKYNNLIELLDKEITCLEKELKILD